MHRCTTLAAAALLAACCTPEGPNLDAPLPAAAVESPAGREDSAASGVEGGRVDPAIALYHVQQWTRLKRAADPTWAPPKMPPLAHP